MTNCKPTTNPHDLTLKYTKAKSESENKNNKELFQQLIGKLFYLSNNTRPDLSAAVAILSSYVSLPTETHYKGLKRILRYCKSTLQHGLCTKIFKQTFKQQKK